MKKYFMSWECMFPLSFAAAGRIRWMQSLEKTGSFRKAGGKKRAEKEGGFQEGRLICHGKPRFPEKAKERPDLGGLSSGGKNRKRDRLYHRRTVREDPGD